MQIVVIAGSFSEACWHIRRKGFDPTSNGWHIIPNPYRLDSIKCIPEHTPYVLLGTYQSRGDIEELMSIVKIKQFTLVQFPLSKLRKRKNV